MFSKTIVGKYKENRIHCVNSWFDGMQLYLNGEIIACSNLIIFPVAYRNMIEVKEKINDEEITISVYGWSSFFRACFHLKINGDYLFGDER